MNTTLPLFFDPLPPDPPGVRRFFTQRLGGVSSGSLASLNLGQKVGDTPENVAENRRRLMSALGLPPERLCLVQQVHEAETRRVEAPSLAPPPEGDALVTDRPGLVLGILTADCAPVLLADPQARVIGAAHAGWRGAVGGILESALHAMERLGAQRERILALTGPCIRQEAFEVGPEVRAQFLAQAEENLAFFRQKTPVAPVSAGHGEKYLLDLAGYIQHRLHLGGLRREHIHDTMRCTFTEEARFFSHRRSTRQGDAPCGRQLGGLLLLE